VPITEGDMSEKSSAYPNLEALLDLQLPVIVVLAEKQATLEEVLNLAQGGIIVFKKHNSEPLDLLVNNQRIATGKAVKVGEKFGLHVRGIESPRETLRKIMEG